MYDKSSLSGSGFSRNRYNEAKMGAYYTDLAHCKSISEMFSFPDEKEVCVLEPSIGDGSAVAAVCGLSEDCEESKIKIFGVELDQNVARETGEKPFIEDCIRADFTDGVKISNNVFSFVFSNPPYIQSETEDGERLEMKFLRKISESYIKRGGILVWVVPYRVISDPRHFKYLFDRYERLALFKFREDEYAKFGQVVYVGRRIATNIHLAPEIQEEAKAYAYESAIPVLPDTFEGTELYRAIEVNESPSDSVKLFAAREFDKEGTLRFLANFTEGDDYRKMMTNFLTVKPYAASDLGKPPIPLKKDSMYLLATSGAGQGKAGTPGVDLHLQRGVAEVVEDKDYKPDPNNKDKEMLVVTTHTRVTMTLIETSGKITTVE